MKGLLVWLWLAQGADATTTAIGLHRGCVEQTYYSAQRSSVIVGGKIGATFVLTWSAPRMPHGGKVIIGSFAAAATTAAVLNLRTIPSCKR